MWWDELQMEREIDWQFQLMFINVFTLDVEKQLAVEKESLENLRKQIEEAQKQSGENLVSWFSHKQKQHFQ